MASGLRIALCVSDSDMNGTPFAFGSEDGLHRCTLVCQDEYRKYKIRMGNVDGMFGEFQVAQSQAWEHLVNMAIFLQCQFLPESPFSFFW